MTQFARLFTALLAVLMTVGCVTTGSLEAARVNYNQAEAERTRAETEAAAAAQRQADAEKRKIEAGKALAGGLVKAAGDDVAAAEAAKKRAEAKRKEACGLNPDLPECKTEAPAPPAPAPASAPPPAPAPQADPAPAPSPPPPPQSSPAPPAEEAPQAADTEPEPEADNEEAELPHAHIQLRVVDNKTTLNFLQPLPEGWKVNWKTAGVLAVTIGEKEAYTVRADRLGINQCWRLGVNDQGTAVVVREECPSAEGE